MSWYYHSDVTVRVAVYGEDASCEGLGNYRYISYAVSLHV